MESPRSSFGGLFEYKMEAQGQHGGRSSTEERVGGDCVDLISVHEVLIGFDGAIYAVAAASWRAWTALSCRREA